MSERNDSKVKKMINFKYREKSNVLIINYDNLLVNDNNSQSNVINYIFNKFNEFIPKELKLNIEDDLIKDNMEKRFNIVNEIVEQMKYEKFDVLDNFTGIHGSHRNRLN